MKFNFRTFAMSLLACVPFFTNCQELSMDEIYIRENNEIINGQRPRPVVVFMGNSITEGWPKEHRAFFTDNNFAGRGISGQTTTNFLARFKRDVVDIQPQIVVINGGTNDIAENGGPYDEELTYANIVKMAEMAKEAGITVILSEVLPASKFYWHPDVTDVPQKQKSLNERIRNYASEQGYGLIEYYSPMVTEDGSLDPLYTKDGVHPNRVGYDLMESIAMPVIRTAIENLPQN